MIKGIIAAALAGMLVATSSASAQEPYYKGKRLTVLVNFAPGGGVDIEGDVARHIVKHIEGRPTVVVQNMDGAAGLGAVNYLGEVAPKDGTVMGYFGGIAWQYASEPERFRKELKTYEFIAYQPMTSVYFARTDVAPGIREAIDIVKAQGLISGGLGRKSPSRHRHPPHARHAGRPISSCHRLSKFTDGATGAATQ